MVKARRVIIKWFDIVRSSELIRTKEPNDLRDFLPPVIYLQSLLLFQQSQTPHLQLSLFYRKHTSNRLLLRFWHD